MTDNLIDKKCQACEGGVSPLSSQQAQLFLRQVPKWTLSDDAKSIFRDFEFKGHLAMMSFLNAMVWISQQEGHHPDVNYSFKTARVAYTTHAIDGLSENDFICAAKVDRLFK